MGSASDTLARLRAVRGFVFDMDGTLVLGDRMNKGLRPLPGALDFIKRLTKCEQPFVIMTNGTTRTPEEYTEALREIGFPLPDNVVITPSSVAAEYLSRRNFGRVMALGCEGVWRPLEAAGIEVVHPKESTDADAVYVGWHRGFTMEDLDAACAAIWGGAKLFAASSSPFFATAHGRALGTSRAISAAITSITGVRAKVLGKPSLEALRCAGERLNVDLEDIAVVGDDPSLEVPMAHRGSALAVAVQTGIGDADAFSDVVPDLKPHITVGGVDELLRLYVHSH